MNSVKCPQCGLVAFASVPTCKRCGRSFAATSSPRVQTQELDAGLLRSIKAKQTIIYGLGFTGALALSIAVAVNTEDATRMAVFFVGIVLVGFLSTWAVGSKVESRMLGKDYVYTVTVAEKSSVLTSSLLCAFIVFSHEYGFILSPLIVVFFNGALYLYDLQMKAKRRALSIQTD